jgi:D-alanyl-D-alanine carboxypeptidase
MSKKTILFFLACIAIVIFAITSSKTGSALKEQGKKDPKKISISSPEQKYHPKTTSRTVESGLDLSTISGMVFDAKNNEIIYQKDPLEKRAPASITKILTLSTALDVYKEDQLIKISQRASEQEASKISMKPGEELRVSDLLSGLMMISANDAAFALADGYPQGFDAFIARMNDTAKELKLNNTNFANPAGLDDPNHYSCVYDFAVIANYVIDKHPEFLKYAGNKKEYSVYATDHNEPHWWAGNQSKILHWYNGMIAAKPGFTNEAKSTYVVVAERNGRRLIAVIMGSTDASGDLGKLLDFGFAH